MTTPDMRAWMSLPARFHAARLRLAPGAKRIRLVAIGHDGRELARTTVSLGTGRNHFIYARSLDNRLTAQVNKTLWTDGS